MSTRVSVLPDGVGQTGDKSERLVNHNVVHTTMFASSFAFFPTCATALFSRSFHLSSKVSYCRTSIMAMASTTTEQLYKPFRVHRALFQDDFAVEWLHDDFVLIQDALAKADKDSTDTDELNIPDDILRKEMDGVYSFNVFNSTFLDMFNAEINNFYAVSEREHIPIRRPNSMNNYGVVINEIGMRPMITAFQQTWLWPLCTRLFREHSNPQFDDHHSFIVRYRANEDLGLDMHTDDSDVTFNVCLGDNDFTGATLSFCGMFGASDHRQHTHTYHHHVGRAILHLGSRRHGADDIQSGRRSNLIIWNHNWTYRASGGYRHVEYQQEQSPPSPICLSYTHDRDYQAYKKLPEAAKKHVLRPWCPPVGTEYDGFRTSKKRPAATTTTIQSQDEL